MNCLAFPEGEASGRPVCAGEDFPPFVLLDLSAIGLEVFTELLLGAQGEREPRRRLQGEREGGAPWRLSKPLVQQEWGQRSSRNGFSRNGGQRSRGNWTGRHPEIFSNAL